MLSDDENIRRDFDEACEKVKALGHTLNADQLLFFYARYKQGVIGPCNVEKPSFFDFQGKQKWSAWKSLGDKSSKQAIIEYIEEVQKINPGWITKSEEKTKSKKNFGPVQSVMLNTDIPLGDHEKTAFDYVKENDIEKLLTNLKTMDVNEKDSSGMTLLHWASDRCHTKITRLLIERGADLNCQDTEGQTPLHYAYSCEHQEIVDLLLSSGADANIQDRDGNVPGNP